MYRQRHTGKDQQIKMGNISFESLIQLRYLGKTLTNENSIYPEIKSRFKTGNTCYNSMQNLCLQVYYPKIQI